MIYDLSCRYDSRQSFYGKAKIELTKKDNIEDYILFSYNTPVARIEKTKNKTRYIYYGKYSQTTTRHQKEFFKQFGLSDKEIKDLFIRGELVK